MVDGRSVEWVVICLGNYKNSKYMAKFIQLILLLSIFNSSYSLCNDSDLAIESDLNLENFLIEYSESAMRCIERLDTNHPIFHGCIDWHSAVHAHWALIRSYRFTRNHGYLQAVQSSFEGDGLQKEKKFLLERPDFEMPYGRAWFLKLACEYKVVTGKNDLDDISKLIALSLFEHVMSINFDPSLHDYQNMSWALLNLYEYYKIIKDKEKLKYIENHVRQAVNLHANLTDDFDSGYFFSNWGIFSYLLSLIMDESEYKKWISSMNIEKEYLQPIKSIKTNHELGTNFSRSWGFWKAFEITHENRYYNAYISSLTQGLSLHKIFSNDYNAYGHWVPQFGILSITIPYY